MFCFILFILEVGEILKGGGGVGFEAFGSGRKFNNHVLDCDGI